MIASRRRRLDVLRAGTVLAALFIVPPAPIASSAPTCVTRAADPDFGPNVIIFDPSIPSASIQRKVDSVLAQQESSEFGEARLALLFKPGAYDVNARVGFYTQLSGLGLSPDDVAITGGVTADARWRKGNATLNFWRIVENMSVRPTGGFDRWAVSQAAPMRRMHIRGDLVLDDGGWSSGGFLADSKVDGQVRSGSQQQWLTRNSELGSWTGANWNMVFIGTVNAPSQTFPTPPYTTVATAPLVREKPLIYVDARGGWKVFVPAFRSNTRGTTWSGASAPGISHPLSEFVIVKPGSSPSTMNAALALGKNLIVTPGVYHLDAPVHITHANTIVLGLGLATFVVDSGTSAITVDDVDGVVLAGLLVEAGPINSPVLIQVGTPGSTTNHARNPTSLSDVFVRVGGAGVGKATQSVVINSNNVVGDHLWLWRADHGHGVGWTSNTAENGLVVNGNDVTMYGLFVEHYQGYQVLWNGNGGRTYFFQNEMPYDVPDQGQWMSGTTRGFAAYHVAPSVTSHEAWGLGSYCFFYRNPGIVADRAFAAPSAPGIRFHDMVTVSLGGGKGTIEHVLNTAGAAANASASVQKLVGDP
ncbi:MAG: coagulation factor 5/8 type domain-containing protein [Gemmatimonadota bacterium]|nr:coagulation factor 5/8 type domain-containing protein [Gemmatimonadota bacterium]